MTPAEIYARCERRWPKESQLFVVIEECSEFAAAVARFINGKCDEKELLNEAADVSIMLDQFARMVGRDFLAKAKERKIAKLEARLDALDVADAMRNASSPKSTHVKEERARCLAIVKAHENTDPDRAFDAICAAIEGGGA